MNDRHQVIMRNDGTRLDVLEEDYAEAFRLARQHHWLLKGDEMSLGLQALLEECRAANHPWLPRVVLEHLKVLTSWDIDEVSQLIADQIEADYAPSTTLITAVSSDSKPDGSEVIANTLKGKLGRSWQKSISNSFSQAFKEDKSDILTYILIDDFIGTGSKIIELATNLSDHLEKYHLENRKIVVATFASMKDGEAAIKKAFPDMLVISGYVLCKAISEMVPASIRSNVRDAMIEAEGRIVKNFSKWQADKSYSGTKSYNFGFNQSEALIWIEGFNIPNNVFPLLWLDNQPSPDNPKKRIPRRTLFKRR